MLDVVEVKSHAQYVNYMWSAKCQYAEREALEAASITDPMEITLDGYCAVCHHQTTFHVDMKHSIEDCGGHKHPNWHDQLVCTSCQLNNWIRASLHLFIQECAPKKHAKIYITEQNTPLFRWVKEHFDSVVGSELLGSDRSPIEDSSAGIRQELPKGLSCSDGALDYILSFDALQHIPDYKTAIRECARVLREGGQMLFSVPFSLESDDHILRA